MEHNKGNDSRINVEDSRRNEPDYASYIGPLITEIRNAIKKQIEQDNVSYTEFDVYNALALSMTLVATRNLKEDLRDQVNKQSIAVADHMIKSGLETAKQDQVYLAALLIGASRSVSTIVDLIEGMEKNEVTQETE
jgi:hypothetical protein